MIIRMGTAAALAVMMLMGPVLAGNSEPAPGAASDPTAVLHQLFDDEWANRLIEQPLTATRAGVHAQDRRLPSVTPADHARRLAADRAYLARLEAIDRASLSPTDRLNYDLFAFVMGARIADAAFRPWRIPFFSDSGFHTEIARIGEMVAGRGAGDYENYIARLGAIPVYFDQQIANMRIGLADGFTMPREILDAVAPTFAAQSGLEPEQSPLFAPFNRLPDAIPEARREALRAAGRAAIDQAVLPAYRRLDKFFREEYMPGARTTLAASTLPDGEAYYRRQIRDYTTLDRSPRAIHELGLTEVARIHGEMMAIIDRLDFKGGFAAFLKFLRTDPQFYVTEPVQLLKEASWIAKQIDGQLPAFFTRLPRQPYGVRPVPDDIAANYTTGRYWGAARGSRRGGSYMVNTHALNTRPLYALPALTLHEAMPGHHLQIALAQELKDVPAFRRALYLSAFGEGWGLYAEKLGLEMGLYDTPYKDFGRLTYEMWRACRLVVDTGIHAFGWSSERARRYMAENTALSLHNIHTEVDRYISWPGQALAYKLGELKILELRARAKKALGGGFDIREFHDAVLANGALPLDILDRRIDRFIAGKIAGKVAGKMGGAAKP